MLDISVSFSFIEKENVYFAGSAQKSMLSQCLSNRGRLVCSTVT